MLTQGVIRVILKHRFPDGNFSLAEAYAICGCSRTSDKVARARVRNTIQTMLRLGELDRVCEGVYRIRTQASICAQVYNNICAPQR